MPVRCLQRLPRPIVTQPHLTLSPVPAVPARIPAVQVKALVVLKAGAQVMCTANLMQGVLVNGSRGVVVGFVDAR